MRGVIKHAKSIQREPKDCVDSDTKPRFHLHPLNCLLLSALEEVAKVMKTILKVVFLLINLLEAFIRVRNLFERDSVDVNMRHNFPSVEEVRERRFNARTFVECQLQIQHRHVFVLFDERDASDEALGARYQMVFEGDEVSLHRELYASVVFLFGESRAFGRHDEPRAIRILEVVVHVLLQHDLVFVEGSLEENVLGKAEEPSADRDVFDDVLDEAACISKAAKLLNHQPSYEPINFVAVIHEGEVVLLAERVEDIFLAVDYQL